MFVRQSECQGGERSVTYKAKLKTLYVKQILEEETDAEHGLSMRQIIERLEQFDIKAERKSVYRDIEVLREFGYDIRSYQRNPVEYETKGGGNGTPSLRPAEKAKIDCARKHFEALAIEDVIYDVETTYHYVTA